MDGFVWQKRGFSTLHPACSIVALLLGPARRRVCGGRLRMEAILDSGCVPHAAKHTIGSKICQEPLGGILNAK